MSDKLLNWLKVNGYDMKNTWLGGVILFLFSHHARAIISIYIVSNSKNKLVSLFFHKILRSYYHIECCCKDIGYGLMIPHPRNIIMWAERIGDNVLINQNVTIGGNLRKERSRPWGKQTIPIIKNNVMILTNAVVGGPIIIEDNVVIGANCTCTHDVDQNSIIYSKQYISDKKIKVTNRQITYIS